MLEYILLGSTCIKFEELQIADQRLAGEWKEKDRWEGGKKVHKKRTYWCGVPQIDGSVADGGTVSAQERTGWHHAHAGGGCTLGSLGPGGGQSFRDG